MGQCTGHLRLLDLQKDLKLEKHHQDWSDLPNCSLQSRDRPFKRPRLSTGYCMDPSLGSSNSSSRPNLPHNQPLSPSTSCTRGISGYKNTHGGIDGEALMRGHSDADVLTNRLIGRRSAITNEIHEEGQTWMDFIRSVPDHQRNRLNSVHVADGGAELMAADRRKRLAERQEEHPRRRASASLSSISQSTSRLRQISTPTNDGAPFLRPPPFINSSPPIQRFPNRPLPRPPNVSTPRDRTNRDITLPKWQPDAEASKCPICGTSFSFWYRKHHCRKCGRVVCGSCSPHRITIPRQFIVHSPEEGASSPVTRDTVPEVVDLTGENDSSDDALNSDERPQSSDYRIDPALGGGQEVRLCNPCVPDPNPLPHLPLSSSGIPSFDSFQRNNRITSHQRHPSTEAVLATEGERSHFSGRTSSSKGQSIRRDRFASFDGNTVSAETLIHQDHTVATARRHSHAPRPLNLSTQTPGYPPQYGSVPDAAARQVGSVKRTILIS